MSHNEPNALVLREHVAAAARRLAHEGLLVGTAGNVSAPRIVRLAEPRLFRDELAKVSLYYVPGARLLVQARTLCVGAAAVLLAALALVFAWRSRKRRAA